ncbi:beta-propeller fold lactonase family protein [Ramlibacter humi]|uniref:Lactonase family protein n=1 Tax=Ramlibacter humi TaxID=2530451 RepID=A0A4Z0CA44_9BURK|nr:beta-propeller fold lactonase family protein [Ramlibacter humi]TFZ07762.1 hypothetical protein EZ216_00935 [Ramlibacter humi]
MRRVLLVFAILCHVLLLAACGGKEDEVPPDAAPPESAPGPQPRPMAITVQGLLGTGLQVRHAGTVIDIGADGQFASVTPAGGTPTVEVATQPVAPPQRCSVSSATEQAATIMCGWPQAASALVGESGTGTVKAFDVAAAGAVTPTSAAIGAVDAAYAGVAHPSGRYFYVPQDASGGTLGTYAISPATGELTELARVPLGLPGPLAAMDPKGRFVVVTGRPSGFLQALRIDAATGLPERVGPPMAGAGPNPAGLAFHPAGTLVYAVSNLNGTVRPFLVNPSTGSLTGLATLTLGQPPSFFTVDPRGRFLFTYNGDDTLTVVRIGPGLGDLTEMATTASPPTTAALGVRPQGDFLFALNFDGITVFAIDGATGALSIVGATVPAGNSPGGLAIDPAGEYLLVSDTGSDMVLTYAISASGALTPTGTRPSGIAFPDSVVLVPRP